MQNPWFSGFVAFALLLMLAGALLLSSPADDPRPADLVGLRDAAKRVHGSRLAGGLWREDAPAHLADAACAFARASEATQLPRPTINDPNDIAPLRDVALFSPELLLAEARRQIDAQATPEGREVALAAMEAVWSDCQPTAATPLAGLKYHRQLLNPIAVAAYHVRFERPGGQIMMLAEDSQSFDLDVFDEAAQSVCTSEERGPIQFCDLWNRSGSFTAVVTNADDKPGSYVIYMNQ